MSNENQEREKGKPVMVGTENHKKLFGIKIEKGFSSLDLAINELFKEIETLKKKLEEKK